jgi:hypothetical protein
MMIPAGGMLTAVHSAVQEPVSVNSINPKGNIVLRPMLPAVHSAVQEPVSVNSTNPKGNIVLRPTLGQHRECGAGSRT